MPAGVYATVVATAAPLVVSISTRVATALLPAAAMLMLTTTEVAVPASTTEPELRVIAKALPKAVPSRRATTSCAPSAAATNCTACTELSALSAAARRVAMLCTVSPPAAVTL